MPRPITRWTPRITTLNFARTNNWDSRITFLPDGRHYEVTSPSGNVFEGTDPNRLVEVGRVPPRDRIGNPTEGLAAANRTYAAIYNEEGGYVPFRPQETVSNDTISEADLLEQVINSRSITAYELGAILRSETAGEWTCERGGGRDSAVVNHPLYPEGFSVIPYNTGLNVCRALNLLSKFVKQIEVNREENHHNAT